MIITRSPLRVTLGGGGTDLPSYYKDHEGFLISAAIDKYVYLSLHQIFIPELIVKYSSMEKVSRAEDLQHPLMREALKLCEHDGRFTEICSMADIPAGTGLGSSGSFLTALLKALHTQQKRIITREQLAEQACHIEIDLLGEPVGKQDQYIAAYGGLTCFRFNKDGKVDAWPLQVDQETLHNLEDNLMLFFTGFSRKASTILNDQDKRTKASDQQMIENLHFTKELGFRSQKALESGDLVKFGELMHEHWLHKKARSGGMSNPEIDKWYDYGMKHGAIGGKLIGAGGGGFLMFYTENNVGLRRAMAVAGMHEVRFHFDFDGCKVVI